ncbi:Sec-independent protein translocase protein TatB [Kaistia geumhonensis]|uniref:Sec-independent protein translocase protein TatB n=1 Tax=Kaistia geumhonensis TaxID=410839 RepID=A0ABU0M0F8_9HYPH|nr:Sec-independent protein translocase protein TatB [Kaistia geumhonensis]MCX5480334.1 Sec-independent protein translocase protein TatB [Kaistia geumhonensis]MDQ0514433.1 sec-independent protein translocase protein TatB [Kaistia geumhonensis]
MFDIGWSEILVIAVVAIVVVGPKDLPPMLRAAGRMMAKVRRTAGEFQSQFNEALREAELDGVKDSINELRGLNPLNEIKKSLDPVTAALAKPEPAARPAPEPVPPPATQLAQPMSDDDLMPAPDPMPVDRAPIPAAPKTAVAPEIAAVGPETTAVAAGATATAPGTSESEKPAEAPKPARKRASPKVVADVVDAEAAAPKPRASRAKKPAGDAVSLADAPSETTPAPRKAATPRARKTMTDGAAAIAAPATVSSTPDPAAPELPLTTAALAPALPQAVEPPRPISTEPAAAEPVPTALPPAEERSR